MRCLTRLNARVDRWFRQVFCEEDLWMEYDLF
jgi:hypothetical protein